MEDRKKYHHKIAIKYNDTRLPEFCAICGEITKPDIPIDLFLEDSQKAVCPSCGMKYAPDLIKLLAVYYD